jgi:cytidylate kinase
VSLKVIAIDGPAASGKSSTAAAVATRLGWAHLDSGALYRAVTLAALDNLGDAAGSAGGGGRGAAREPQPARGVKERREREEGRGQGEHGDQGQGGERSQWGPQQIVAIAESLPVRLVLLGATFRPVVAGVDVGEAIRSERVTQRVSEIAALREVRHWVNVQQREAVLRHAGGVVVDGRDIGTVVFPDAPLKVFLTASPAERARRRLAQRGQTIDPTELTREAAALAARDQADSTRAVAPLRAAADAVRLDTTVLSLEEQVNRVVALARERHLG